MSIKQAGTSNCAFEMKGYLGRGGAELSKLYTRSGYVLHFNPFEDESEKAGCVLEIPHGRKFMRKLAARFNALERSNNLIEVSDLRDALRQLDSIKNTYGHCTAKEVRFLASQILSGFTVVSLERGDSEMWFKNNGITLERSGRKVTISDAEGKFEFEDDFYNTGLKALFWQHLKQGDVAIAFADERERGSVKKLLGDVMDESLVGFFLSGDYAKKTATRFWGGDFKGWRPLKLREYKTFRSSVKLARINHAAYRVPLNQRLNDWENIVRDILKGNVTPAEREHYKDLIPRNEFRRMRKELSLTHRYGSRTFDNVCKWVTSYLVDNYLLHGKRDWAYAFLIRGKADLLHWDGGLQSQYVSSLRGLGLLEQKKDTAATGGCA